MADIFISYKSSDRTRAETLQRWFKAAGWTTWIDRELEEGAAWNERIEQELAAAKVVVVIWGAEARRSEWVVREARAALGDGRLVQVQATGLPLAPPFDVLQAIRMQSWSGAAFHGEKNALMAAVARKLGVAPPAPEPEPGSEGGPLFDLRAIALVELVFEYCARHIEFQRRNLAGEMISPSLLEEKRLLFNSLLDLLRQPGSKGHEDDRVGLLEPMIDGFDRELQLLAPDPRRLQ